MGKETLLTGEIELDFTATRISVGPNVPKPKVTVRNFTQPGKVWYSQKCVNIILVNHSYRYNYTVHNFNFTFSTKTARTIIITN